MFSADELYPDDITSGPLRRNDIEAFPEDDQDEDPSEESDQE